MNTVRCTSRSTWNFIMMVYASSTMVYTWSGSRSSTLSKPYSLKRNTTKASHAPSDMTKNWAVASDRTSCTDLGTGELRDWHMLLAHLTGFWETIRLRTIRGCCSQRTHTWPLMRGIRCTRRIATCIETSRQPTQTYRFARAECWLSTRGSKFTIIWRTSHRLGSATKTTSSGISSTLRIVQTHLLE